MDVLAKHGIEPETVVSQEADEVVVDFFIPASCDFFKGHFPEIQLIPAVGQVEIVVYFANKYFGWSKFMETAKRVKFTSPVRPDSKLRLRLKKNEEKHSVTFKLSTQDEQKFYSNGSFVLAK
ncbi:MAG: hydroxymyristoyl-ACP dehydratase [Treponema sp.]|nr:hydroxymyristoyl-ACP dehydratase [Treponema sp.]